MTSGAPRLLDQIRSRRSRAGVVGLGYVGLPLAVELARAGFETIGIDVDERKVDAVNRGASYIPDVSTEDLASLVSSGTLRATTGFAAVADLDTINICVPTPLRKTKDPDMSFVAAAVEGVAAHLHPGMLVVLESTTYPGTTEEFVKPGGGGTIDTVTPPIPGSPASMVPLPFKSLKTRPEREPFSTPWKSPKMLFRELPPEARVIVYPPEAGCVCVNPAGGA